MLLRVTEHVIEPWRKISASSGKTPKLAASIGLVLGWYSWQALLTGAFLGPALAAVCLGALIAAHRASRASQLPFGPFMLAGALAAIVTSAGSRF